MTLNKRIIREDEVFIAGDKEIFNEGVQKIRADGRPPIEKLVIFDKLICL